MAYNMKGFAFTLDALFALIVAGMGISMLMYMQYISPIAYQTPVQEAHNLMQSLLQERIASTCSSVSLGSVNGCMQASGTNEYSFGSYLVQPYQSVLQAIANMYLNGNVNGQLVGNFSGTGSYISIPSIVGISGSSNAAVSAWILMKSPSNNVVLSDAWTSPMVLQMYVHANGSLEADFGSGSDWIIEAETSSNTLSPGRWYDLMATWQSGNGISLYVNGQLQSANYLVGNSLSEGSLGVPSMGYIGYSGQGIGGYFDGLLANIQVYSSQLNSSQSLQLYYRGVSGHPLGDSNLMGWWPLNGTPNDYSGNDYNGTSTSVAYFGQTPSPGPFASALLGALYPSTNMTIFINNRYAPSMHLQSAVFNGFGSIDVPSSSSLNFITPFSVEAWFETSNSGVYQTIINKDLTGEGYNQNYHLRVNNNNVLFARYGTGATSYDITGNTVVTDGRWHQAIFVWDGQYVHLYLDGAQDAAPISAQNLPLTNTDPLQIGTWAGYLSFNGLLSNVQIYGTALTAPQIMQLYTEGIDGAPAAGANMVGWWPLDGNANDYTIHGNGGYSSGVTYSSMNTYVPVSFSASSLVSEESIPLLLNASGTDGLYNVSVVIWR